MDRTLIYATGGLAFADFEVQAKARVTTTLIGSGATSISQSQSSDGQTVYGWTLGGGFEHAFTPNLSAKVEYLYVKLDRNEDFDQIDTEAFFQGHLGKVGVNYRF